MNTLMKKLMLLLAIVTINCFANGQTTKKQQTYTHIAAKLTSKQMDVLTPYMNIVVDKLHLFYSEKPTLKWIDTVVNFKSHLLTFMVGKDSYVVAIDIESSNFLIFTEAEFKRLYGFEAEAILTSVANLAK